jgi:hypothetical protein
VALVLAAHPTTWQHLGQQPPGWLRRNRPGTAPQERIP